MKRHERGSATVWGVLLALVLTLVVGITVDLTGQVNAQQRALDLAQQAGRAAANEVEAAPAMQGRLPVVELAAARAAAARYLAASHVQGSVTATGPASLRVHVSTTYQPVFLGAVGFGPKTVTGQVDVTLARVVNGAER